MNLGLKTDGKKHTLRIPRAWAEVALRVRRTRILTVSHPSSRQTREPTELMLLAMMPYAAAAAAAVSACVGVLFLHPSN